MASLNSSQHASPLGFSGFGINLASAIEEIGAFLTWKTLLPVLLVYISLCSLLRFQRIKNLRQQSGFTDRASLSRMTNKDAQEISKFIIWSEFPTFYDLAMRVALVRTYAVEPVAKLLVQSSDLSRASTAPKRYEDTAVLYSCFARWEPESPLFQKAVARMNFLHQPYIQSGRIKNDDLLYVLCAGAVEPVRFMKLFEWRPLDDIEKAALGTLWRNVGELMGINYKTELGRDRWQDGIEFLDDMTAWAPQYLDRHLHRSEASEKLGNVLMEMLLSSYPSFARPLGFKLMGVLLGDHLRHIFNLPEPSIAISALAYGSLLARQFVLRYLTLPRFAHIESLSEPDPKTGRISHHAYMKEPWYNPSTFANRWGLEPMLQWLTGGLRPGDKGAEYKPEGFLFEDIGPKTRMWKESVDNAKMEEIVRSKASSGCPFAVKG